MRFYNIKLADGRELNVTSFAAIYDFFTADEVGARLNDLYTLRRLNADKIDLGKSVITQHELYRKPQRSKKK